MRVENIWRELRALASRVEELEERQGIAPPPNSNWHRDHCPSDCDIDHGPPFSSLPPTETKAPAETAVQAWARKNGLSAELVETERPETPALTRQTQETGKG